MKKSTLRYLVLSSILFALIIAFINTGFFTDSSELKGQIASEDSTALDKRMQMLDSLYEAKNLPLLKEELTRFRNEEKEWSQRISANKLANVYDRLNEIYDLLEDVKNARLYAKKALKVIDSTEQKYFYATTLNDYALAESQLENYDKAINIQFRALDFLGTDTLNSSYGYLTQNLGNNFRETNDLDLALKYYEKSEAVVKAVREIDSIDNFDEILGYVHANVGYVYSLQGKIKRSNEKYASSIKYFEENKLFSHKNIVKSVLASNYIEQGLLYQAEKLLDGILAFALKTQDFELYVETSISLFKLNIKKGKTEQALEIINEAQEKIGISNANRLLLKIQGTKTDYYKNAGNFEKAFSLLEKKIDLQDSIYNATQREMQRELSVKYQTDLKNERIDQLEIINQKEKRIRQFYLIGIIVLASVVVLIILLLRRISKQKKEVEGANYTKDQLFSIIAHDLRSPILALQGMGDLIQYHIKKNDQDKLKQLGDESQLALSKVNQLLQNLLDWSLANKDQLRSNPENVNIDELISQNILLFDNLIYIKQIKIDRSVEEKTLFLDKNMVSSAIRNILSNAIKLSPENSRLIINGKTREDDYLLSIEDEAGGMPTDILNAIKKDKDQLIKGQADQSVGLGLRLIKLFTNKNQAQLDIINTEKGTKVSIYFPLKITKSE